MANEWDPVELYGANNDGTPRRYTIADGASVSKGQPLQLTSPRTVTAATDALTASAGVASMEHKSGDGTSISAWTDGVFDVVASGAINVGDDIRFASTNRAAAAGTAASGSMTVGYALETAAAGDTINVRLRL